MSSSNALLEELLKKSPFRDSKINAMSEVRQEFKS